MRQQRARAGRRPTAARSTSSYSAPPAKTSGERAAPGRDEDARSAQATDEQHAARPGRAQGSRPVAIDGKATTTTNWGRNITAWTRSARRRTGPSRASRARCAPTMMSTLVSAKKANSACELRTASLMIGRSPCRSCVSPGSPAVPQHGHQPTSSGAQKPMATPRKAMNSVGRQRISARPMTSRGTPRATYMVAELAPPTLALQDAHLRRPSSSSARPRPRPAAAVGRLSRSSSRC